MSLGGGGGGVGGSPGFLGCHWLLGAAVMGVAHGDGEGGDRVGGDPRTPPTLSSEPGGGGEGSGVSLTPRHPGPSPQLTVYLGKRDFVDHIDVVDPVGTWGRGGDDDDTISGRGGTDTQMLGWVEWLEAAGGRGFGGAGGRWEVLRGCPHPLVVPPTLVLLPHPLHPAGMSCPPPGPAAMLAHPLVLPHPLNPLSVSP